MTAKNLIISGSAIPATLLDSSIITEDYFIKRFADFLPQYISRGRPAAETLRKYISEIRRFLAWCFANNCAPLKMNDYQVRMYREYLFNNNYSSATISHMLISARTFFMVAYRLGLIKENPCQGIELPYSRTDDFSYRFFDMKQIKRIDAAFAGGKSSFVIKRNRLLLYLMAIEGLRNIELFRMNREDIDCDKGIITVHGKGHIGRTDTIYPCKETMLTLQEYLESIPQDVKIKPDNNFTPLFISDSNRKHGGRLSQHGIRFIINKALKAAGLKHIGYSCHILRHSCGTNLYQATKDLRIVQETLRQKDPKTTARYAHVHERINTRPTGMLFSDSN